MEARSELPIHPIPQEVMRSGRGLLRVDGLVERAIRVDQASLAQLSRMTLDEPFTCEEGWTVPDLRWHGVRLLDILGLAQPLPEARFVRICAGAYVLPLSLAEAGLALMCDELNGRPLEVEHGAPWRLVVPGAACFASVKWVERLELASTPGANTAQSMARARLASADPDTSGD